MKDCGTGLREKPEPRVTGGLQVNERDIGKREGVSLAYWSSRRLAGNGKRHKQRRDNAHSRHRNRGGAVVPRC